MANAVRQSYRIGYETKLSTKGQVVLPKAVRDRLSWAPGETLEVVEQPGGVTLRAAAVQRGQIAAKEAFAKIAAINPYCGPPVTDEDIERAIRAAILKKHGTPNS